MDIRDLVKNLANLDYDHLNNRLQELVDHNPRFYHFSRENKELLLDLLKKYRDYLRQGIGISETAINHEYHELYERRLSLKLSEEDLRDIRELLEAFKK
jgi:hypothetical protein